MANEQIQFTPGYEGKNSLISLLLADLSSWYLLHLWLCHDMEMLSALLALCERNPLVKCGTLIIPLYIKMILQNILILFLHKNDNSMG